MIDRLRELLRADGVTAGPWWALHIAGSGEPGRFVLLSSAGSRDVEIDPQDEADARLIAEGISALPELLDAHDRMAGALRDVLGVNHSPFLGSDGYRPCQCAVHEAARAALAVPKEENPE